MSRVTEARQPNGPGLFALQHHQGNVALEMRSFMAAVRVTGREPDGTYVVDKPGDLIGAFHWSPGFGGSGDTDFDPNGPDGNADGPDSGGGGSRKIGAWSWVFPVVTSGSSGQTGEIGTINGQQFRGAGMAVMADGAGGEGGGLRGRFASAGIVGALVFVPHIDRVGDVKPNPDKGIAGKNALPTAKPTGTISFQPTGVAINAPFGITGGGFFDILNTRPGNNRFIGVGGTHFFAFNGARVPIPGRAGAAGSAVAAWSRSPKARRILTLSKPVRGDRWKTDGRFALLQTGSPRGWPDFPISWHGVMVQSSEENLQRTYMHPTDPRLVAVHETQAHFASSLVCDLDPGDAPDLTRHARLSCAMMVVRGPSNSPDEGDFKDTLPGRGNSLAWVISKSKQGDVRGGYVMDYDTTGGPTTPRDRRRRAAKTGERDRRKADFQVAQAFGGANTSRRSSRDPTIQAGDSLNVSQAGHLTAGRRSTQPASGPRSLTDPPEDGATSRREFKSGEPRAKAALILACASINDGGPFDVGGKTDIHRIGTDSDRNPINALHISTEALYRDRENPKRDGPMLFSDRYEPGTNFSTPTEVHLAWDSDRGAWAWWSTTALYSPGGDPPRPPTIPPRDPPRGPTTPRDPPPPPTTPGTPRGPTTPGTGPNQHTVGAAGPLQSRRGLALLQETAHAAITGRPQLMRHGDPDTRYQVKLSRGAITRHDERTPLTIRMEAYGAQGGKSDGPYLRNATPGSTHTGAAPWVYTQKPTQSRAPGGTAPGGFVFLPPEIDLADIDNENLAPTDRSISTSYVVMGPGVCLGFGVPELAGGGLRDGFVVNRDATSGNLVVKAKSSTGADGVTILELLSGGGIKAANLKSGTTQVGAGAATGELWVDTDDANTVKLGT